MQHMKGCIWKLALTTGLVFFLLSHPLFSPQSIARRGAGIPTAAGGASPDHYRTLTLPQTSDGATTSVWVVDVTLGAGKILDAQCDDVIVSTDIARTVPMHWYVEPQSCDTSTGKVRIWFGDTTSTSAAVVRYLHYGDATVTTFQGGSNPHDANTWGHWHFGNGVTMDLTDSSGNGRTVTGNGTTQASTTAQLGGAVRVYQGFDYILIAAPPTPTAYTACAWSRVQRIPTTGTANYVWQIGFTSDSAYIAWDHSNAAYSPSVFQHDGGSYPVDKYSTSLLADTYYLMCGEWDGTTLKAYLNGVQEGTPAAAATMAAVTGNMVFGNAFSTGSTFNFLDDCRYDTVARGAVWEKYYYLNTSNAGMSGWIAVGSEV